MEHPGRGRLVVVDRDPYVCKLIQQFLSDGWEVVSFADGYAALDHVRKMRPKALITEILVPELDGLALCGLLKSDPITQHVPILVFSMLASRERAMKAGANGFLDKPVERMRLIEALREVTSEERRATPERAIQGSAP